MKARAKGDRPRTRFTTTLDTFCLESLKADCEEKGLSVSMVLDMLISDYIHGNRENKGVEVISNMFAEPMVVDLILGVILPELKRKVSAIESAFKETREMQVIQHKPE